MTSNFENNCMSLLAFASTRSTWVSVSSCASKCNIDYDTVRAYFVRDDLSQIADFYRYDYRIRRRLNQDRVTGRKKNSQGSFSYYISVVSRGYA